MEDIGEDRGTIERLATYGLLIREGYSFQTNCLVTESERKAKQYQERGLEVKVHPYAFSERGERELDMVAILTRRNV